MNIQTQYHPTPGKVSYQWSQNESSVTIDFKFALKLKDSLKVDFQQKTASISFNVDEGKKYELTLVLFDDINASASKHTVHIDRIEVVLEKATKKRDWALLEKAESKNEKVLETIAPKPISSNKAVTTQAAYPTSSKVKRDWNKLDKEIEKDIQEHKEEYSEGDPVNGMFKMLYDHSDEATRRAMMKSYQTSGGTVLSMNWDEVKTKDYEGRDKVTAPDGQEWRKWEK